MSTFASLRVPNYRRYFTGALASNTGTWMARTAQAWLVLVVLTDQDAIALGIVTGLTFLPSLLFSPLGGSLADRFPKRKLMMVTQSVLALTALILGLLVVTGTVELWHVYVCAFLEGTGSALDAPARQSFVSEMVPKNLLTNAIGLNSTSFNTARLLGPGIAGLLIAAVGTGWVLLINAATFLAILLVLATLNTAELTPHTSSKDSSGIRAGFAYVRQRPYLLLILTVAAMMGMFGMNFQMTNALMSTVVFGKGATEYGILGSVMAVGSLTAALLAARRQRPRLRVVLVAFGIFIVCTLASAAAPNFIIFAVLLVPCGLAAITVMITCNSLLQLTTAPEFRGRVMALYLLLVMGSTPIGAPLIGWIAENLGARWTLGTGGLVLALTWIAVAAYLFRTEDLGLGVDRERRFPLVLLRRSSPGPHPGPPSAPPDGEPR